MLSDEEKKEMLEDAKSIVRRNNFRAARAHNNEHISFDDYLLFLDNIQKIFSPFKISKHTTRTKFNKL